MNSRGEVGLFFFFLKQEGILNLYIDEFNKTYGNNQLGPFLRTKDPRKFLFILFSHKPYWSKICTLDVKWLKKLHEFYLCLLINPYEKTN